MEWNNRIIQKIKAVVALALVFLLVLATNMMDNHHFDVVKQSLKTVYEDRLVVKDYIYKMSAQLNRKQLALIQADPEEMDRVNSTANDSLRSLVQRYSETKLTRMEADHFSDLQENLSNLYDLEKNLSDDQLRDISRFETQYARIAENLSTLSEIQLREGKRQIENSNRAIAKSDFISTIEIGVLILIGLIVQIIILYKPRS